MYNKLCKDNSEHVLKTTRTTFWRQLGPLFEDKKKRTKCVKIIFISISRDNNNIIHKNNVTRRSKALLTKCTIFHKKHYVFYIRMYNI